jgi:acyl-CoA thioester hydrolase
VNHANYLRYMQETAFDASAAAGYALDRYRQINRAWLVRETDITYLRPLVYNDSIIVKTWVLDFRRVRSRRAYELRHATNGEIVAQAATDWVFLNDQTHRPVTVPQEMIDSFFPDGPPAEVPPRERFPKAPTMTRMMDAGFGLVARRYRIEYRQPAVFGDTLEIATWASNMRRVTAERHYTICRAADGELLARAHVLWVWIDLESGRPFRVPADFRADFAANVVD